MGLGTELQLAVIEMLTEDDGFGSKISVRFNDRTVDVTTGSNTTSTVTQETWGAVADPIDVESFFGQSTLTSMRSAVIAAPSAMTDPPELHDEIAIQDGIYLRVIDVNTLLGPNSTLEWPVVVAYIIALGS
jgi:hypothetical protein